MSSLIVVEVSLVHSDDDTGQSFSWIEKRVQDLLSGVSRRYDSLTQKTPKITRLYDDLIKRGESFLKKDPITWKTPDSARKAMESLFRKAERFKIVLVQILLEEHEIKLMEETYLNEIQRYLSGLSDEHLMSVENQQYVAFSQKVMRISDVESLSDRILQYKTLIPELALLYHTSRQKRPLIHNRINELKKELASLELKQVSMQDLEIIHSFTKEISKIFDHGDVNLQETQLIEIDARISAFSHQISGFEHTDIGDLKKTDIETSLNKVLITKEASKDLLVLEADFFHGRIRFLDYDNTEDDDYEPVDKDLPSERLALQRDNLQLEYGLLKEKIPEKTVIRQELDEMIQSLSVDPDAGALLDAAMILFHDPFPELRELAVIRRQYDTYFLQKKRKSLSDDEWVRVIMALNNHLQVMGYRVHLKKMNHLRDAFRKASIEIGTPLPHYSVMISINPLDELVFRMVRVVDGLDMNEFDPDRIQENDVTSSKAWSDDFDSLTNELKDENIVLIERLRKNPEEVPIHQVTRFDLLTDDYIS